MTARRAVALAAIACAALPVLGGCRGGMSSKPPVHLVQDMDFQPKLKAQSESEFFADHVAMRMPLPGTVARGTLREGPLYRYLDGLDQPLTSNPVPATREVFERGRERFNIHCAPCHDRTGSGQGLVAKRWPVPIPSFYEAERMNMPPGRIVKAISEGFNTMPSYAHQVEMRDRWAIARYIEALQFRINTAKN